MSLQARENQFSLRHFMEACVISGGRLTITADRVEFTTEDDRVTGLKEVADKTAAIVEQHWEQ